jgi:hypothetical protein
MTSRAEIRLAGVPLGRVRHVCAFFDSDDEARGVLLPFIREGLDQGDRAFLLVNAKGREEYLRDLTRAGVNVAEVLGRAQLEIVSWEDFNPSGQRFDQGEMLARVEGVLERGRRQGSGLTRFVADMGWSAAVPAVHEVVEFEARLDDVLRGSEDPVICAYNTNEFPGRVLMDVFRTHPIVLVGGVLHENPFYVTAHELLHERKREDR